MTAQQLNRQKRNRINRYLHTPCMQITGWQLHLGCYFSSDRERDNSVNEGDGAVYMYGKNETVVEYCHAYKTRNVPPPSHLRVVRSEREHTE